MSALALMRRSGDCGDAHDAVAIYRVAQESIGHARMGGGPALMGPGVPRCTGSLTMQRCESSPALQILW